MTAAILTNDIQKEILAILPSDLRSGCGSIPFFQKAEISEFREFGEEMYQIAQDIKQRWESFSENRKNNLKSFAYKVIEPRKLTIAERMQVFFINISIRLKGQTKDLEFFAESLDNLVDTILDAIETHDLEYQCELSHTLEELSNNFSHLESVDPDESREWFRKLSSQDLVLRKINNLNFQVKLSYPSSTGSKTGQ